MSNIKCPCAAQRGKSNLLRKETRSWRYPFNKSHYCEGKIASLIRDCGNSGATTNNMGDDDMMRKRVKLRSHFFRKEPNLDIFGVFCGGLEKGNYYILGQPCSRRPKEFVLPSEKCPLSAFHNLNSVRLPCRLRLDLRHVLAVSVGSGWYLGG